MLGPRVDRILVAFRRAGGPHLSYVTFVILAAAFLVSMVASLFYALRTLLPPYMVPVEVRDHGRRYWCDGILAKDVETSLETMRGLDGEALLKEMTRELYSAVAIERRKFERATRSIRWALASFARWVLLLVSTFLL